MSDLESRIREARRRGWKPDLSSVMRMRDAGMEREAAAMLVQHGFATEEEMYRMLQDKRLCLDIMGNAEPVESRPMSDDILDHCVQYVKMNKALMWDETDDC